jgi:hypothetical protein
LTRQPINLALVRRFRAAFPTHSRSYAWFETKDLPERVYGEKTAVKGAKTILGPVPDEDIWRHIVGEIVIGLSPICEDSKTNWGGIDFDNYWISAWEVDQAIQRNKKPPLPLIAHHTKSAARGLLFTKERVSAELIHQALAGMAGVLPKKITQARPPHKPGPAFEIFPKQTWFPPGPDDHPTVVWLPYSGDRFWAIQPGSKVGGELTLDQFLGRVERWT